MIPSEPTFRACRSSSTPDVHRLSGVGLKKGPRQVQALQVPLMVCWYQVEQVLKARIQEARVLKSQ